MLKPGGFALLCLGAKPLVDDVDENYRGSRIYCSNYDTETYLEMLKDRGFPAIWSKGVVEETCEGSGHLFVLVR